MKFHSAGGELVPQDCTFEFKVENITTNGASVTVTPSNPATSYFWQVYNSNLVNSYLEGAGLGQLMADGLAIIAEAFSEEYGFEITPEAAAGMVSVTGEDSYVYTDWDPDTEYYVVAVGLDDKGRQTTDVQLSEPFRTLPLSAGSDTPENPGISGNPPSLPAKDRLTANISATDIGSEVTGTVNGTTRSVPDSISDQIRSTSRRNFISATAVVAATAIAKAQEKKVDGGLATIEKKAIPERKTSIVPPGALSLRNFYQHCTACQLCVSVCPNDVLRPSGGLMRLMQPEMSYERGYCRPECTKCSDVCPAGAIRPVTVAEKSSIQVGHAVWIKKNCIVMTDDVECGNCARHCPTGAIQMVEIRHRHRRRHGTGGNPEEERATVRIPVINQEKCIGCGACENLCPARPFTAIYVEGHEVHREI